MPNSSQILLWTQPDWLRLAHAWIYQSLRNQGKPVIGPVEQIHVRPWSTILRAPITGGYVFFKASIPLLAGEPALTQMLYRWRPDCTFPVLAADFDHGWLLVPDGGPMLRAFHKTPADLWRFERLLQSFAGMQIDMIDHLEGLLPLVPLDRHLDRLPGLFEQLLEDHPAMRIGQKDGLREEQVQHLHGLLPRYQEMCAQLAAYPIPQTLHHDDFHDGNVFGSGEDSHYIISDWAESCLTHPFFSMLIFLRAMIFRVGLPEEAVDIPEELPSELTRLRDLYLEPWERFETRKNLVRMFNLTWRVGMVNRALAWHQVVSGFNPAHQREYGSATPAWLGEFLTLMEQTVM